MRYSINKTILSNIPFLYSQPLSLFISLFPPSPAFFRLTITAILNALFLPYPLYFVLKPRCYLALHCARFFKLVFRLALTTNYLKQLKFISILIQLQTPYSLSNQSLSCCPSQDLRDSLSSITRPASLCAQCVPFLYL